MIDSISSNAISLGNIGLSSGKQGGERQRQQDQRVHSTPQNTDATGLRLTQAQKDIIQTLQQQRSNRPSAEATLPQTEELTASSVRFEHQGYSQKSTPLQRGTTTATLEEATSAYTKVRGETGLAPWGTGISLYI